jgi:hypothetical protein
LNEAKREDRKEGIEAGRKAAREEFASNLIAMNLLTDEQIATASGLTEAVVKALRST